MDAPRPLALVLAAFIVAVVASGCAGVLPGPRDMPPKTYLLAPNLPSLDAQRATRRGSGPTLLVSPVEAAAGYGTRRMGYLEQDYRLDYFADHEWVDTPATMLGPLLVRALRESGAFGTVSDNARGIDADLRLDTAIESIYQDFRTRPSRVRVELRLRLVALDRGRILATQGFSDSEPALTDDPYGGVVALNRALDRLLPRIAEFAARTRVQLHAEEGPPPVTGARAGNR
jgi:cholesterol transport system auxiliary component